MLPKDPATRPEKTVKSLSPQTSQGEASQQIAQSESDSSGHVTKTDASHTKS
jgi:hypothetical protein